MSKNPPHDVTASINKEEGLVRQIGVFGLTANIVNIVIGAGIFVMPAAVALEMGAESIIAYLFCGVLVLLVMMCFAEVGSKITISGGPYAYIHVAFGDYAGFLTAILFLGSTLTADAAVTNALYSVIAKLIPAMNKPYWRVIFLVVVIYGIAWLNLLGIKQGITMIKIVTVAKLLPILGLILFGWLAVDPSNLIWKEIPEFSSLASLSLLVLFAFQGAESGLPVGGEVKNPQKTIPKALFLSLLLILVIYILVQTVSQGVLGDNLVNYQESPLAEVAYRAIGTFGFTLLIVGAAVSMFGNVAGELLNIPRVLFSASRDKTIPFISLSRIHPKYKTPHVAIFAYASIGLFLALFGGFKAMAIASSVFILLIYMGIAAAVIKFRISRPELKGFHMPGGMIIPIITILVCAWFINGLTMAELQMAGLFLIGTTVVYFIQRYIRRRN